MSRDAISEFPASGDDVDRDVECFRRNFVDSQSVPTPLPMGDHAMTIVRLHDMLEPALPPEIASILHFRWRLGPDDFWIDVFVVPRNAVDRKHSTGAPILVVDVHLAARPKGETTVKLGKYALAGLPRYWNLDLRDRALHAHVLADGAYRTEARLDDDNPIADLETGVGPVRISLTDLLP